LREADLKLAVSEYLQYKTNLGELYADRLNSGEVIIVAGQSRRRVKLCREGTADFMVLRRCCANLFCRLIFLELKGDKGKQRPEGAFQKLVGAQGAEYHIVRSVEEVADILGEEL